MIFLDINEPHELKYLLEQSVEVIQDSINIMGKPDVYWADIIHQ